MKIITSFSYKGGAGRTVASGNIAAALASAKKVGAVKEPLNCKVALLDLDVFSAGMHRVFEIANRDLPEHFCVQDYLLEDMTAADYVANGGITYKHPCMENFRMTCLRKHGDVANPFHTEFTLFPAAPKPDGRFKVAKYHDNQLLALLMELDKRKFDYVIIDGESGIREMADIAIRLADIVLMFFRPTWQHIEGTLKVARDFLEKKTEQDFYLIPTCVPQPTEQDGIYQKNAPGREELERLSEFVPQAAELNAFAQEHQAKHGYFWTELANRPGRRACIHDSLFLKGGECVLVFDPDAATDRAAADYYYVASELRRLHPPRG